MENQQLSSQEVAVGQFDRLRAVGQPTTSRNLSVLSIGCASILIGRFMSLPIQQPAKISIILGTSRITVSSFGKPVATMRTMLCPGTRP